MRIYNQHKLRWAKRLERTIRPLMSNRSAPTPNGGEPRTILVGEFFLLGDLIMALPTLRAIRSRFASSKLTLLGSAYARDLLEREGLFDEIVEFRCPWAYYDHSPQNLLRTARAVIYLRRRRFDLAVDLRGDFRNNLLLYLTGARRRVGFEIGGGGPFLTDVVPYDTSLTHQAEGNLQIARFLGAEVQDPAPRLTIRIEERQTAMETLRIAGRVGERLLIGIHPGASRLEKLWPVKRHKALIRFLLSHYSGQVVLFGSRKEVALVNQIASGIGPDVLSCVGPTVRGLAAVMHECDLVIGMDSGPIHLAAAVGTPTVGLFGPKPPWFASPYMSGASSIAVYKSSCDCIRNGYARCDNWITGYSACMCAITLDDVTQAISGVL
jgi:ADP-heptose:LPS heptosyltransferase